MFSFSFSNLVPIFDLQCIYFASFDDLRLYLAPALFEYLPFSTAFQDNIL